MGKVNKKAARQGHSAKKLFPEMKKTICKKGLGGTENPAKTPVMPVAPMVTKINEVRSPSNSLDVSPQSPEDQKSDDQEHHRGQYIDDSEGNS